MNLGTPTSFCTWIKHWTFDDSFILFSIFIFCASFSSFCFQMFITIHCRCMYFSTILRLWYKYTDTSLRYSLVWYNMSERQYGRANIHNSFTNYACMKRIIVDGYSRVAQGNLAPEKKNNTRPWTSWNNFVNAVCVDFSTCIHLENSNWNNTDAQYPTFQT